MNGNIAKQIRILTLPFDQRQGCFDDAALRQFFEQHQVLQVKEHFFQSGDKHYLSVLLTYAQAALTECRPTTQPGPRAVDRSAAQPTTKPQAQDAAADPYQTLNERERATYAALRAWRAELAERQNLPLYAIAHNKHLALIVKAMPRSKEELARINGFGLQRAERYGAQLLAALEGGSGGVTPHSSC